jgi:hypothetical protein
MNKIMILLLCAGSFYGIASGKTVEFIENPYAVQAPQALVDRVDKVAQMVNFDKPYEVAIPKKAGLQVNPVNKFINYDPSNPQTLNPYIILNPDWFLKLPEDQQTFWLARTFLRFEHGMIPLHVRIAPFLLGLLNLLIMVLLYFALARSRFASHKRWMRIVAVFAFMSICNVLFINKLHVKFIQYLGMRHDHAINEMIIEKTGDREAAIRALESFSAEIKKEVENGQTFWKPFEVFYVDYAEALKNNRS